MIETIDRRKLIIYEVKRRCKENGTHKENDLCKEDRTYIEEERNREKICSQNENKCKDNEKVMYKKMEEDIQKPARGAKKRKRNTNIVEEETKSMGNTKKTEGEAKQIGRKNIN